ncbi:MAG TPA: ATPase domain-containing protein [Patescibacteria group bacterium]|nr:ATPase domain-containing protein [Patescibacteria group bacterium]
MGALPKPSWDAFQTLRQTPQVSVIRPQAPEFSGIFRGHELTRKDRRLSSGLAPLDALIDGGIPRGRISEITGRAGSGKTSIAASFAAFATRRGEVAAWLDASGSFDPESMAAAGVDLRRMLWASMATASLVSRALVHRRFAVPRARRQSAIIKAAELVLEAGGFGLVVVDFGEAPRSLTQASALRIARAAERSGAAVIAIAPWRMCGTFAALSLSTNRAEASFARLAPGSPAMFDGLAVDAMVARNKMGGTGRRVRVRALVDPTSIPAGPHSRIDVRDLRIAASS